MSVSKQAPPGASRQGAPIIGLDHLTIGVANLSRETANYTALLGADPVWSGRVSEADSAVFDAGNIYLCLTAASAAPGLHTLCFAVDDALRMQRRLNRVGLTETASDADPLAFVESDRDLCRLAPAAARALPLAFAQRHLPERSRNKQTISGLDHLVITSGDATATAFLLAAQLGLDMRMDLLRPEWGARLMFFRCGDAIVEVMQPLSEHSEQGTEDSFYGLSWRVPDATHAQQRLAALDFDVSEVRDGRKPGTRVFTVRNRTAGIATLIIQPAGR